MALLSLTLEAETSLRLHQPRPIRVRLKNVSDRQLWIVGCVDGAQAGARYPIWRAHVEGPITLAPPETPDVLRPLLLEDFHRLEPGAEVDPTSRDGGANWFPLSLLEQVVEAPGTWRASLELDMTSADPERWFGGPYMPRELAALDEVKRRLAEVPRVAIRSNMLEVRVA